jgi:aminoglycoside phosphotransferase (APT) family kinase protein
VIEDLWSGRFQERWERCRPHLSAREREWVERVVDRFARSGGASEAPLAVVHGDLAPEHVIVAPDGSLAGVIDWSGPRIADPAFDLGGLFDNFQPSFAASVVACYGGAVDGDVLRRARFYADVRPLSTIALGLAAGEADRVRRGRDRLARRMALG